MGAWGTGLYANDVTCDVRDSYMSLLREGMDNLKAYEKTIEEYREYIGEQEEPLFWFALAETQWKIGRLLPEVKAKALDWVDKGGGLELWEESANGGSGWKKTLQKLKIKLLSDMPQEKKIRKPQEINNNLWNLNNVYAYRYQEDSDVEHSFGGKYMLLQKIGEGEDLYTGEICMRIHVLDRVFDKLPTLEDMQGVRILPLDFPTRVDLNEDPVWMSGLIRMFRKSEYPAKYLTFIGNIQGPANKEINNRELTWGVIDTWLYELHQLWHGVEYETIEEGVYRYQQE